MKRHLHNTLFAAAALACLAGTAGCSGSNEAADEQAQASLTVRVASPEYRTWPREITASGALQAWQEMIVSAETGPYRITAINVDVGSSLAVGSVLATLSRDTLSADRARLQAAVAEAEANLGKAQSDVARATEIENSGALSAQQIESYRVSAQTARAQLASARAQLRGVDVELRQTAVRAPDSGVVSSRSAVLGKVVSAGEELFRMVRRGIVEWQAELDARQMAQVKVGQSARVTLPSGEVIHGTVREVSPTLASNTGRGIAYVRLPVGSAARAGMYGSGTFEIGDQRVLTVPESSVVLRDDNAYVYVLQKDNTVKEVNVKTGARREQRYAVAGVAENAKVVANGAGFLSDGAVVRVEGAKR